MNFSKGILFSYTNLIFSNDDCFCGLSTSKQHSCVTSKLCAPDVEIKSYHDSSLPPEESSMNLVNTFSLSSGMSSSSFNSRS